MVQAESLMSPPLRGRMRDGAVPQSSLLHPETLLRIKGDKLCSKGISLAGSVMLDWVLLSICSALQAPYPAAGAAWLARQRDAAADSTGLRSVCLRIWFTEALGFPRAGEVVSAQIMQHLLIRHSTSGRLRAVVPARGCGDCHDFPLQTASSFPGASSSGHFTWFRVHWDRGSSSKAASAFYDLYRAIC